MNVRFASIATIGFQMFSNLWMAAPTARWSVADRLPIFCRINRLSRVNSFIRTLEGDPSPTLAASISRSIGHGGFLALVIIASKVWPLSVLNASEESVTAGRRLLARWSVNGNGTITTSYRLQITISALVVVRAPLGQGAFERC